jgi:hypothetical protein
MKAISTTTLLKSAATVTSVVVLSVSIIGVRLIAKLKSCTPSACSVPGYTQGPNAHVLSATCTNPNSSSMYACCNDSEESNANGSCNSTGYGCTYTVVDTGMIGDNSFSCPTS